MKGLFDFFGMSQHGNQQIDLSMRRRPQYRAQLAQKHARVSQTPANGPQAQCRVQMRLLFDGAV